MCRMLGGAGLWQRRLTELKRCRSQTTDRPFRQLDEARPSPGKEDVVQMNDYELHAHVLRLARLLGVLLNALV